MLNSLVPMFNLPENVLNTLRYYVFIKTTQTEIIKEWKRTLVLLGFTRVANSSFKTFEETVFSCGNTKFRITAIPWDLQFIIATSRASIFTARVFNYYTFIWLYEYLLDLCPLLANASQKRQGFEILPYRFEEEMEEYLTFLNWEQDRFVTARWILGNMWFITGAHSFRFFVNGEWCFDEAFYDMEQFENMKRHLTKFTNAYRNKQ